MGHFIYYLRRYVPGAAFRRGAGKGCNEGIKEPIENMELGLWRYWRSIKNIQSSNISVCTSIIEADFVHS